ncbi:MAG: ATP-binding cassette domain-containing protein [Patescibacteria group bacterium]|nr:ATP-binding cassette domain-containing protein [Patescibacteria group bacterium]
MIIFKNISKIYENNIIALDNVSFEIKAGEFVLLIGKSGAGKSTILKILRREEEPTRGKVVYKNIDILSIPRRRLSNLRKKIAIIHQDFKLLNKKSVFDNISLPLEIIGKSFKEIKREVNHIAEKLKLKHKLNQIVNTLSGGEKQRVCLARCLIFKPEVILADEPTGNLDPIATFEIIQILRDLNREEGISIVLATHNKEIVDNLKTRVLTLESGRLIRDENPGDYTLL